MRKGLKWVDAVWLLLLAGTGLTWWLDAAGWLQGDGRWRVGVLVLALAWCKGMGVLLEFMELRHAPALWRRALVGLFTLMLALIALALWLGRG